MQNQDECIMGDWESKRVTINHEWLNPKPSQKIFNHSPDGFNWGYGGSGPAQFALALLLKFGVPNDLAVRWHNDLKFDIIAKLPQDDFMIPANIINDWIARKRAKGI